MIGNSTSLLLILASSLFKAIGQGAGSPALQAEVIKRMDKNKSGVAASTVLIGMESLPVLHYVPVFVYAGQSVPWDLFSSG